MERSNLSRLEDLSHELDGLHGLLLMAEYASVQDVEFSTFESAFRTMSDNCFNIYTELEEIIGNEYKQSKEENA